MKNKLMLHKKNYENKVNETLAILYEQQKMLLVKDYEECIDLIYKLIKKDIKNKMERYRLKYSDFYLTMSHIDGYIYLSLHGISPSGNYILINSISTSKINCQILVEELIKKDVTIEIYEQDMVIKALEEENLQANTNITPLRSVRNVYTSSMPITPIHRRNF